ncbi:MAG: hypothetical protein LKF47_03785 [Megasphaera sp.]|nr:hypothetical protein [Megasphaera sp.]MCI1247901.1 hypothetical protein [Megasphaera sp.]
MVFFAKQQDAFAGLEENLNIPALAVDAYDVFLVQIHIRTNQRKPIFAIIAITHADNPGINHLSVRTVLLYLYRAGQKIS